jgi:hypothetical protein
MVHATSRTRLIHLFPNIFKDMHRELDLVTTERARSVGADSPASAHEDEYMCILPVEVSAVTAALKILLPAPRRGLATLPAAALGAGGGAKCRNEHRDEHWRQHEQQNGERTEIRHLAGFLRGENWVDVHVDAIVGNAPTPQPKDVGARQY